MTTKFAVSLTVVAVCLLSLAVAISVPPGKYAAIGQFRDFMTKYNKNYPAEEMKQRFAIFSQNLKKIEEMNAKSTSATFAVNKFADLSAEEFKRYYMGTKVVRDPNWETLPNLPEEVLQAIPESFDWVSKGAVTGVKDQGQCGSCWSFSTTGNVEGQWFLAGNDLVGFSEQDLVDCDHFCMEYQGEESCDAGCDGGLMPNAFRYIIASGGINTEAEYPYIAEQNAACKQDNKTLTGKIDDWKMIPSDEGQMAAYLARTGPVSVAVDADAWQFYFGGVLQISIFCGTSLDHGVLIVGYGNETNIIGENVQFWNIKNSWGADWGESGYIRIERGQDECGVDLFPCTSLINKRK